ncbi:CD2 antigen cytoplasmic tail-binding protein 2 homolog [Drosophila bipectinata]|uniref:CD2 antigen cytoplasmic tail-binding protein 2 homolog n=1 Tax=Drosophila bipectinata TaxID=42026 RepID=UPI001C8A491B|nr:CD2 antigen cytoplasmic tail-binding protein 2 homolog [Drosophila bipectinata]
MATKRKHPSSNKVKDDDVKKHTLDSDEEDSDDYEREYLNDSDIEGGEEGIAKVEDDVKVTPFNMKEELEEGHFDKDGHYHWNKETEAKDNWLDNIDWMKIENQKNAFDPAKDNQDSNSSDDAIVPAENAFNLSKNLTKMLEFMKAGETVKMTLQRLGSQRPVLTTLQRIKQKKAGVVDTKTQEISKLTELANEILSKTGNMDIYEETFEAIKAKIADLPGTSQPKAADDIDMYADDFESKELERSKGSTTTATQAISAPTEVTWEFKWSQNEEEVQGPYSTEKMLKWSKGDYFKNGVYVRKCGENTNFYSSNRIDFDLYL